MKKVPEKFIEKIRDAMDQLCELDCEDCVFNENGLCDTFSDTVNEMECVVEQNNKLEAKYVFEQKR